MNSALETIFSFIFGLVLASGIIWHFSPGTLPPVLVTGSYPLVLAFVTITALVIVGAVALAASATASDLESQSSQLRCSHGIAGANLKRRCKQCDDDHIAADRLLKVRQQERQLRAAANELQIHERNRLSAILVPRLLQIDGPVGDARELSRAEAVSLEPIDGKELLRWMFDGVKGEPQADRYRSVCLSCGDIVVHHLWNSHEMRCKNGHLIAPNLTADDVLQISPGGPRPICVECGAPMRLVEFRTGISWGCSRYPTCHATQEVINGETERRRRSRSARARAQGADQAWANPGRIRDLRA
ncbi:MAG TPA: hypothetical protein VLX09_00555 [Stellaceae bacterium]|nr:hypothetical protein [Stellaceae bacterium]